MPIEERTGKLTALRIHDLASGFGPPDDRINVEVVIRLDVADDMAFGFQLRNDGHGPAREGMLILLRDAFIHDLPVSIEYEIGQGKRNGVIFRVQLRKTGPFL